MRYSQLAGVVAAILTVAATSVSSGASPETMTVPNTFVAGTPAKAADVNANFTAVADAINSTAHTVTALQTTVQNVPAGPEGPQGPQGPTGAAGASLSVYDANNVLIGPLFPSGQVLITSQGSRFYTSVNASGFVYNGGLYFTTSDCTGTPYFWTSGAPQLIPFATPSAPGSSTLYLPGTGALTIGINSGLQPNNTCYSAQFGTPTVLPVVAIVLPIFVTPFSAH